MRYFTIFENREAGANPAVPRWRAPAIKEPKEAKAWARHQP